MNKNDWVRKLTSRQFWAAVASFVSLIIVALGGSEETAIQTVSIVMAGATVMAYIIGEGLVDATSIDYERVNVGDDEVVSGGTGASGGMDASGGMAQDTDDVLFENNEG